jgi:hypothetical protein
MPKAVITTKQGATVEIEGSQEEVLALVALFDRGNAQLPVLAPAQAIKSPTSSKSKPTLMALLAELIVVGFFATPKGLSAVREALEERGHFYPVTTLSPVLLRLVRKKELRRLKDRGHWTYLA